MEKYDFSGWATKANLLCSDGRVIRKDAFKHNDGQTVPLVWNHQHSGPDYVLGHALLENRDEGVYVYGTFNDTESGRTAKHLVQHGDVTHLSIYANQLKQQMSDVLHGNIREVSLVLAGANPGASIVSTSVVHNADGEDSIAHEEGIVYTDETISLYHAEENADSEETLEHADEKKTETGEKKTLKEIVEESFTEEQRNIVYGIIGALLGDTDETDDAEEKKEAEVKHSDEKKTEDEETVEDVFNTFSEKQKAVVYALIAKAVEDAGANKNDDAEEKKEGEVKHSDEESIGGENTMKTNVFDKETEVVEGGVLTHADQEQIIKLARTSGVGSLQEAIKLFAAENKGSLAHGFEADALEALLPDFKNLNPGAPDILRDDQSWVMKVINKIHKSPYSRIRTRQADARIADLKAKGYQNKGDQKKLTENIKLIGRTTDPQTIYLKDELNRDDIVDIVDFDVVAYVWSLMKDNMYETLALAALVGDGREDTDPDKIHESHVRSVWNDDELYTIHKDVDIAAAKTELQGTNTSANFGDNYIYAEAIITAALYARENFKGSGRPDLYCAPHLMNVMLLARDLNGRRIYDSKADLAKALNVGEIHEIEQFEGKTRTDADGNQKKLLGLFVNLADYQFGSTKGGEVTKFEDFDIDFNKHKYLMETRLSGALTRPFAAIALEEPVEAAAG